MPQIAPRVYAALQRAKASLPARLRKADDDASIDIKIDWSELEDDVKQWLEEEYAWGALNADDILGSTLTDVNELARKWASEHAGELINELDESTQSRLRELMAETFEDGSDLASKLTDLFDEDRAETIARTELARAQGEGAKAAWEDSGLVKTKKWILGSGHDKDDICDDNAADGEIPFDEEFSSGDDTVPAHPNCVCDVVGYV